MEGKRARIGKADNPYIDPAGYRRYVASSRQRFGALLAGELAGSQAAYSSRLAGRATRQ